MQQQRYYTDQDDGITRPRKRRRKRRRSGLSRAVIILLGIAIALLAILLLFHVRTVNVTGNQYCSEDEVREWIAKDKYSTNSIYVWWKYNFTDVEQLLLVDETEVTLQNPWTIKVNVYEKSIVGYLDLNGSRVYFDKDGVVILETTDVIDGVPCVEGIDADTTKIVVHEVLKTTNKEAFANVAEVSQNLKKEELTATKIGVSGKEITLYFDSIVVSLGSKNFGDKMAQIPPILEKLKELYPGQGGTLHLENYTADQSSISFTPASVEQAAAEAAAAAKAAKEAKEAAAQGDTAENGTGAAQQETAVDETGADAAAGGEEQTYADPTGDTSGSAENTTISGDGTNGTENQSTDWTVTEDANTGWNIQTGGDTAQ
ncbi:cell division protein FtsQ/DivIB [Hespellia stercorisuis]|uniref:Cell division septal protein FtsQ n=1 Tax=Hespellia stercorisuis DSM 15480 TaxID=1121950 RepID=A0A1M6IL87_9FIRM|nr:FtsQ-type POTRA domain-containing protein [Hespellia stercorisuis]SHJ35221.1 Cell division septal protein FtsQ [Hespellia stercorisuis DSM 15480]